MSSTGRSLGGTGALGRAHGSLPIAVARLGSAAVVATIVAYLVANGMWYLVVALLLAVPAFVVLHRYPLVAITVWLFLTPLIVESSSGAVRKVFWLIHRGLPVMTLVAIMAGAILGIGTRKLARLGWPELMMAGYVIATLVSIAYTSASPEAAVILLYDRVMVPMCLYLIVRLLEPDERDLRWMLPAVVVVLLSQSLIGLLSWTVPGLLPSDWQTKLGQRTIGSLRTPDVFGTTVLFCGLFLLHAGLKGSQRLTSHIGAILLFVLTMLMVFMTYSRANWLAGIVAIAGTLYIYRRSIRLTMIVVPLVAIALASGLLASQIRYASERIRSAEAQESALSRLPVIVASIRMFEAKPVTGWGYEEFDRYSRPFQTRVGDIVSPTKPHASHNLYLTTLAEQGIVGFLLLLGPMIYWLLRTRSAWRHIPTTGLIGRGLVTILWLVIASHVIVNNFSRMQVPFGLGMSWLTLGLIASIVARYSRDEELGSVPS